MSRFHSLAAALLLLPAVAPAQLVVVTPSPLLADCAREIGGGQVAVALIPSRDAHSFSPTSAQLEQMAAADLILLNGKGMESDWLVDLRDTLADDSAIFLVGDSVPDLRAEHPHAHGEGNAHSHDDRAHDRSARQTADGHAPHPGDLDPHWWQSPACWSVAATWIADELAHRDPGHEQQFLQRAEALGNRLARLEAEFRPRFEALAPEQRLLVVPHAAFGYLCNEFGLRQLPLLGLGGGGELAARHLEETAAQIRASGTRALFVEMGTPRRAIDQLAAATGVPVAGELLADGDERAELSVMELLRHNLETIASGLAGADPAPAAAAP